MNSIQSSWGEITFFAIVTLAFFSANLWIIPRLLHAGSQVDWPLRTFLAAIVMLLAVGWSAVVLALFGHYSLANTALLLLLMGGATILYTSRVSAAPQPTVRSDRYELGLAIVLLIGAILYARPHEYVLGGSDAGSYINTAATTARTGAYLQSNAWNRFLAAHADVTLRAQPPHLRTHYLQFVGWYFDDADASLVRPQFFPFHPVLLSVAMSLGGVPAGFLVTPLIGVLNIAALYFLARQLFGKPVALLSALLLTVTATQIFFARYPTTEPLTLLLLFTGFLAFQIIWDDPQAALAWGVLGGATLGAAMLTRIDMPLVVVVLLAVLVLRAWLRRWSRAWSAFTLVFLFFLGQVLLVGWLVAWPYVWNVYYAVYSLAMRLPWLVGVAGSGVIVLLIAATLLGAERFERQARRISASSVVRWGLALSIIGLSLYAYFLRPILEPPRMITSWPSGAQFPTLDGQNWVRLGWYLTPLGLGLATAGIAMILVREQLIRLAVVVGIGVLTTIQYVHSILNTPYHIYAMRRYVPIVIPMLWIFAAYAMVALPRLPGRWTTPLVRAVMIALLVGGLIYQDRYVAPAQDYAGSLRQIGELQQQLQPHAILLFAEPTEALFADAFGAPLQAMFDHPIATIRIKTDVQDDTAAATQQEQRIAEFLTTLTASAATQGRPLQLLAVEPIPAVVREHLTLQPSSAYEFTTQMLMNTYDSFPSVTQTVHYGIEIYDVASGKTEQPSHDNVEVDIGAFDAAYVDSGFHGKEYIPGAPTMRWTQEAARLTTPLPAKTDDDQAWELQVRAMIYRPANVAPAEVLVNVDGQAIGAFVPEQSWETYAFPMPAITTNDAASVEIEFITDTFVPAEVGLNNDQRHLGFLLDWIKIVPASSTSSH